MENKNRNNNTLYNNDGYLMNSVGTAAPNVTSQDRYNIFRKLVSLHCVDIVHGDARLANIILVNGQLKWIDFLSSHVTSSHVEFKNDAVSLLKSIYGQTSLKTEVMQMLEVYASNVKSCPNFEEFCAIMEC